MNSPEANVKKYLEMEQILNNLFDGMDFCFSKCIKLEIERNQGKPAVGCCKDKYHKKYDLDYPSFDILRVEREKLFGKPEDVAPEIMVSPCEYHTDQGCILKTHKSPICVSFMCPESIEYLREEYGIFEYDYLGINYAMEWILTGDLSGREYEDFRTSCIEMCKKVNELNNHP